MSAEPYSYYRELRAADSVHWHSTLNLWMLTRYQDVVAALAHPALSSKQLPPALAGFDDEGRENAAQVYEAVAGWMLRSDPPQHTRLRRCAAPAFRGCVAAVAREQISKIARELLDRIAFRDRMDVVAHFAIPLSLQSVASVVGVPARDHGLLLRWANAVGAATEGSPNPASLSVASRSLADAQGYLKRLLAELPGNGRPERDFLRRLIETETTKEQLSEDEIVAMSMLLLLAGHETTTHLVSNSVLALLERPDEMERLRANPDLWPSAIQELLRFASPLQGVLRMATEDVVVGGKLVRKGESIAVMLAAANRDPAVFADPEQLTIGRNPNPHVAFGRGIHYCLGASLGELIAEIGMRALLERFPDLRLANQRVDWDGNYLFRGQSSLRVRF